MVGLGKLSVVGAGLAFCLFASTSGAAFDGMDCAGHLVTLGETPQMVGQECGQPSDSSHHTYYYKGKHGVQDIWTYQRYGSFARVLQFDNGVLVSLTAVSPFDR
jgi:hypothetical protein